MALALLAACNFGGQDGVHQEVRLARAAHGCPEVQGQVDVGRVGVGRHHLRVYVCAVTGCLYWLACCDMPKLPFVGHAKICDDPPHYPHFTNPTEKKSTIIHYCKTILLRVQVHKKNPAAPHYSLCDSLRGSPAGATHPPPRPAALGRDQVQLTRRYPLLPS
jgi:hypothetical protein